MKFYMLLGRDDYAGYWPECTDGEIESLPLSSDNRSITSRIAEYLGDPPRGKPRKKGDFHSSAYTYYIRSRALDVFRDACRGKMQTHETTVVGREGEEVLQMWVLNFLECLDLQRSELSRLKGFKPGKVGMIHRAVFDESRWDGSDLFAIPQNPSYTLYCTERFVEQWIALKFKGIKFATQLFDPAPILA